MRHIFFLLFLPSLALADPLAVCRNLHLDEYRLSPPSAEHTVQLTIGSAGSDFSNTDDTDVSGLLDPHDTTRFHTSVYFEIETTSDITLSSISYLTDNAGINLSTPTTTQTTFPSTIPDSTYDFTVSRFLIPSSAYVNPATTPYTDMRSITLTFSTPPSSTTARFRLLRLCLPQPDPNFCSITTADQFAINSRDCQCQTCYNCGCSSVTPWKSCSHGGCNDGSCWCSPACRCCQDCAGFECNCQTCSDQATLTACSLGATYGISSLSPANGIATSSTPLVISGHGFYNNAQSLTCRFGETKVPASFVSSTQIACTAPPTDLPGDDPFSITTTFSISLDGVTFTDPNQHIFTYVKCPGGCSDSCVAESCRCPEGKWGSTCANDCECVNGDCGSLTGTCSCQAGWTGAKCDVACPGSNGACEGNGSCYYDDSLAVAKCMCFEGFFGSDCVNPCTCNQDHGVCDSETGECVCRPNYFGSICASACPGMLSTSHACSGNGVCCTEQGASLSYSPCSPLPLGSCACDAGFSGSTCADRYCYKDCYSHGVCTDGKCSCGAGWDGAFCDVTAGEDPTLTYFSFSDAVYSTSEDIGTITLNITRTGSLEHDVSVYYETKDLTANAGEDYKEVHNRLLWPTQNSETQLIKILITANPDQAEGEESFEVLLSSPAPSSAARLGEIFIATVLISAKDVSNQNDKVAQVTVRILLPLASVRGADGEAMKGAFSRGVAEALGVSHNDVYFSTEAITAIATSPATVLLTFELLPGADATAGSIAQRFVGAVGDPSSALYSDEMEKLAPIDISFQPEVKIVSTSEPRGASKGAIAAAIIVPMFILLIAGAACYLYRKDIRDVALRKLAEWRFEELAAGGESTNPMHTFADRVRSAFAGGGGNWSVVDGGDDRHFSVGDIDDDGDDVRGRFASGTGGVEYGEDGTELVVVKKDDPLDNQAFSEFTEDLVEKKKRIIQIEL